MGYSIWKLVHVLAVVIFLGNIITGLFWAAHARRRRNPALVRATFDGIIASDRLFTMPGVIGILVSGFAAASIADMPVLRTGWILWGLLLFGVSGIVFGARVAPLQRKLRDQVPGGDSPDWSAFDALYRRWELWGVLALATPLAAAVLMVLKPDLPEL